MDHQFIARQLRKPSGDFASEIAEKMNEGNQPLYDLTFSGLEVNDGDSILEIGFGNGFHFSELLSLRDRLKVHGVDYSKEMVRDATERNLKAISTDNLVLTEGSSDQLPYADQTFDIVFCNMVIYFWDNPEDHLKEIHRTLKPAGKFYTGMRTRESMLQLPFTKYGFKLYSVDEWKIILKNHGFTIGKIVQKMDPGFQENGKQINLQSVSIAAEKVND